jgi:dihydroflavonol-4-reductase
MVRRALLTGGTGFVGSHVAERLVLEGWSLRALMRPTSDATLVGRLGADLVVGEITDPDGLVAGIEGVDAVFHLAGCTAATDEAEYHRVNVEGTAAIVEAIERCRPGTRPSMLVHLSSYAACGPAANGCPRGLETPPAPLTAYGRTKLAAEAAALSARRAGTEVSVIRAPAVYGPHDRSLLAYFKLVRSGLAPLPAGAERRLHLIFAPDLAGAIVRAFGERSGVYPVAEPVEHTWTEVIDAMALALGRQPWHVRLPPTIFRSAAAVSDILAAVRGQAAAFNRDKAEEMLAAAWICDLAGSDRLLNPVDATPLTEGIARTVRWYKEQGWL